MTMNFNLGTSISSNGGFIMKACQKLLAEEREVVKKIQRDEVWIEGVRRHCPVSEQDIVVKSKINTIISDHLSDIENEALKHCYDENNPECKECVVKILKRK